jgi:hypothetical protein
MPHRRNQPLPSLPVANYHPEIAKAVEWLGDRYLLAKPINAASKRKRFSDLLEEEGMCGELQGGRC